MTNISSLERVTLNLSFNKIEDLKYLEKALIMLKSITYLELKLHKTDVSLDMILELIEGLKEDMFVINFNLKMLKVSCDRYVPLLVLKNKVEDICYESSSGRSKMLRSDVVGFDNKYYTIYIKKNDKSYSTRLKGGGGIRKPMLAKMSTMTEGLTMSNFSPNFNSSKAVEVCYQLYTSS